MSGLLRRLRSRRSSTAGRGPTRPAVRTGPVDAPALGDGPAVPGDAPALGDGPAVPGDALPEYRTPAAGAAGDAAAASPRATAERTAALPAGLDPQELAARPEPTVRRSRLRRRLRYLRAAREVLLRDLGGFVLELHRTAGDHELPEHRRLRETKLERLLAVEEEARAIEARLGEATRTVVIREPGLGGECGRCGELLGSDARYCSRCGLRVDGEAPAEAADAPAPLDSARGDGESGAADGPPAPDETPTEAVPAVDSPSATPAERHG